MKKHVVTAVIVLGLVLCAQQGSAVNYYVDSSSGGGNGLSWANAFQTINEGLDALAATNPPTGWVGDHLILVTNSGSTYGEQLNVDSTHNGAPGVPNVLRGLGYPRVVYYGPSSGVAVLNADGGSGATRVQEFTVDGFNLEQGHPHVRLDDAEITLANCILHGRGWNNSGQAMQTHYRVGATITNCVFYGATFDGLNIYQSSATVTVHNCIFLANGRYGINNYRDDAKCLVFNSCFYANGRDIWYDGDVHDGDSVISVDTAVTAGSGTTAWTNCVSRNPGFANMMGNWNFNDVYQNSPGHTGGEGGGGMGPLHDRVVVPTSSQTYYVSPAGADGDGLSWGQAWTTLATASATAVAGDTVVVGTGTYSEELWITNGGSYNLPLVYRAQGDNVVISSANPLNLYGVGDVTVDGFEVVASPNVGAQMWYSYMNTLTNLDIDGGSFGVRFRLAPENTFVDCDIHDASSAGMEFHGNGISLKEPGWTLVKRCRIYGNSTYGIYSSSGCNIIHSCEIFNNGYSGILNSHSTSSCLGEYFKVYNSCVYSNGFGAPVYLGDASQPYRQCGMIENNYGGQEVYNCTFYGNAYAGMVLGIADGWVNNCIFAGNGGCGVQEGPPYGGTTSQDIIAKRCLFWDNGQAYYGTSDHHWHDLTGTVADPVVTNVISTAYGIDTAPNILGEYSTNNIVSDPRFMSTAANNYRLKTGSAAIDAGDASLVPSDDLYFPDQSQDVYDNPRLKLTALDIGAHEWQPWSGTILLIK